MNQRTQATVTKYVKNTDLNLIITAVAREERKDMQYIVLNFLNEIILNHDADLVRNILNSEQVAVLLKRE
jgi:hypothetical protein